MRLIKISKTHTAKDGKEFKKTHFYVEIQENVRIEVEPVVFQDKKGNWVDQNRILFSKFATKVEE